MAYHLLVDVSVSGHGFCLVCPTTAWKQRASGSTEMKSATMEQPAMSEPDMAPHLARVLYQDALDCVAREDVRRAQSKLRLALLYDPTLMDARRELDRLTF